MKAVRPDSTRARYVATFLLVACAGACGGASSSGPSTGTVPTDASVPHSGAGDSGVADSGAADSGARVDSGVADSGAADSGAPDFSLPPASKAASCTDGVAGTWQNVTPPPVEAVLAKQNGSPQNGGSWGTSTVAVDPSTPSTLYVSADGQGLWKSLDCGGTWARIDDPSDGFAKATGSVYSWALVIDPEAPQTLYANDGYGPSGVFKSTDGGKTFKQTFTGNLVGPGQGAGSPVTSAFINGGFIGTIRIDPTNHLHLLVSPHHSCNAPYTQFCLLETFDGAATWTVVSTNIDVANADGPWADLIDAKHYYVGGVPSGSLFLSTNGGTTWSEAAGVTGAVHGWVYHSVTTGTYLLPSEQGVLRSTDGVTWTLLPGTPEAIGNTITGDGKTLYLSRAFPGFTASYYTAPESDPSKWTTLGTPSGPIGFVDLELESVNHFLYASQTYGGLWRYSTK